MVSSKFLESIFLTATDTPVSTCLAALVKCLGICLEGIRNRVTLLDSSVGSLSYSSFKIVSLCDSRHCFDILVLGLKRQRGKEGFEMLRRCRWERAFQKGSQEQEDQGSYNPRLLNETIFIAWKLLYNVVGIYKFLLCLVSA
jgi:hypothetical protein